MSERKLVNFIRVEISIGRIEPHPDRPESLARKLDLYHHGTFETYFERKDPISRSKAEQAWLTLQLWADISKYIHAFMKEQIERLGRSTVWG